MDLPADYAERVYAGVLGKIIGVYLGRPFEGWSHEKILADLGEIQYYVHERRGTPLIVTDDDISGTFTFVRALEDEGCPRNLTAAAIGRAWLNYIIEKRSILWWGGLGMSTEHTAFLRLKHGIEAPESGSIARNSQVVAEQIGAQIFIDGWGMVAPGDPELAAHLARQAGSVSHDGEAVLAAQVVAAIEALAFVHSDLDRLLDGALALIPRQSLIARMIGELRGFHARVPDDWRRCFREVMQANWGYDKYGGNCHVIPNHGVIILALLYGRDSFQRSLMIGNTCGWDTDCNSGNVGCIMGIKNGLAGIDAGPDWRGPVADRLFVACAEGGGVVTDAAREALRLANMGRRLAGRKPQPPKDGARFHFELPGSVQGFQVEDSAEARGAAVLENVAGHSAAGRRSLAIRFRGLAEGRVARAATATFLSPDAARMPGYGLMASPTLYPGQTVRARLEADAANGAAVTAGLYLRHYGADDGLVRRTGPQQPLAPGGSVELTWRVADTGGLPIAEIGVEIAGRDGAAGVVYLDCLGWSGEPEATFRKPAVKSSLWSRAWVKGVDELLAWDWVPDEYRLVQNEGRGLLTQGTREWRDYRVSATLTPHLVEAAGLAARVQGMRRYYALLLRRGGRAQLVRMRDTETVLAEAALGWEFTRPYELALEVRGNRIAGWVDGQGVLEATDTAGGLADGALGLVCEEGRLASGPVSVRPA